MNNNDAEVFTATLDNSHESDVSVALYPIASRSEHLDKARSHGMKCSALHEAQESFLELHTDLTIDIFLLHSNNIAMNISTVTGIGHVNEIIGR
jgi:hypothetical protein